MWSQVPQSSTVYKELLDLTWPQNFIWAKRCKLKCHKDTLLESSQDIHSNVVSLKIIMEFWFGHFIFYLTNLSNASLLQPFFFFFLCSLFLRPSLHCRAITWTGRRWSARFWPSPTTAARVWLWSETRWNVRFPLSCRLQLPRSCRWRWDTPALHRHQDIKTICVLVCIKRRKGSLGNQHFIITVWSYLSCTLTQPVQTHTVYKDSVGCAFSNYATLWCIVTASSPQLHIHTQPNTHTHSSPHSIEVLFQLSGILTTQNSACVWMAGCVCVCFCACVYVCLSGCVKLFTDAAD